MSSQENTGDARTPTISFIEGIIFSLMSLIFLCLFTGRLTTTSRVHGLKVTNNIQQFTLWKCHRLRAN